MSRSPVVAWFIFEPFPVVLQKFFDLSYAHEKSPFSIPGMSVIAMLHERFKCGKQVLHIRV